MLLARQSRTGQCAGRGSFHFFLSLSGLSGFSGNQAAGADDSLCNESPHLAGFPEVYRVPETPPPGYQMAEAAYTHLPHPAGSQDLFRLRCEPVFNGLCSLRGGQFFHVYAGTGYEVLKSDSLRLSQHDAEYLQRCRFSSVHILRNQLSPA